MPDTNKIKVALVSLGCDKNLVDSEVMLGLLAEAGYSLVVEESKADVIILNTCGFIADAVSEGFAAALRLARYRQRGSCKAFVMTGCLSERYRDEIFKKVPALDAILGTREYSRIVDVLEKILSSPGGVKAFAEFTGPVGSGADGGISETSQIPDMFGIKRIVSTNYFAYIKISEGCSNNCTYCMIPSLRGTYRSRSMESLVTEAEVLAAQGVRELIIVAQDTSLYGIDLYGEVRLHSLIAEFSRIPGIEWIRLLYCYPEHITRELIDEMASNPKVCHYIDIPIQHASDSILRRMGRKSSKDGLVSIVSDLREAMPDIILRTTLMTGFPGETKADFRELLDFVDSVKFDRLGTFEYSAEEGSKAAEMPDQVSAKEKRRRRNMIMEHQIVISREKNIEKIGNIYKVLVEGVDGETYYGRSYMDCPDIDGLIYINSDAKIGEFADVKINHVMDYDLVGEIVQ